MRYSIAIVGENWEAVFAAATARTLSTWTSPDVQLWAPSEFEQALAGICNAVRFVPPRRQGFQTYEEVRNRVLAAAGDRVLLLAAGTIPSNGRPLECLGSSYREERHVEWISPDSGPTVVHFYAPSHRPPPKPKHCLTHEGLLEVWEIDGGDLYYNALLSLGHATLAPVFRHYGPGRPLFVYNTNRFNEPSVGVHEQYVILASGLLGLRLVLESEPPEGAKVIVYDINPNQLAWIQFLLARANAIEEFDEAIGRFTTEHPGIEVRPVEPHEQQNAAEQAKWYNRNHGKLWTAAQRIQWEFVVCDLLTDPGSMIEVLDPARSTMFMYLDLFLIWNNSPERPWVEHHVGMARSLEALLRGLVRRRLSFVPGARSCRFQLSPDSPFKGCCT